MNYIFALLFLFIIFNPYGTSNANNFFEVFEKKVSFDTGYLTFKEFFDLISKETNLRFIYDSEMEALDLKISITSFKDKPIKRLLKNLEAELGFQFILKFDEKPYILVKIKDSFKERIRKGSKDKENVDVLLKGASLKDVFSTLEQITGKKFEVQRKDILEAKTYQKLENIGWKDFLEKLSEEIGFNYEIKEEKIRIW